MDMPRPTEAHRALERLAGQWAGQETMHPSPWDPQGGIATGHTVSRAALDGFAVISDYRQERDGRVTYTGHGIHTYNSREGRYIFYWFDCFGGPPSLFKGHFEGDTLTLISQETSDGGPRYSRKTYDLSTPGTLASKLEMSQDGETWKTFMDALYTLQE